MAKGSKLMSDTTTDLVRTATESIRSLLSRCSIPLPEVTHNNDGGIESHLDSEARRRGIPMDGPDSMALFITASAAVATTAYAHLPDDQTRTIICLLTAYILYVDDRFQLNISDVQEFNARFTRGEQQDSPTFDGFAQLLRELPHHFTPIAGNIITASLLNFMTGSLIENGTLGAIISEDAARYAAYLRTLTSASEGFAILAFPAELPIQSYIQALPDIVEFMNCSNDVLSFYKEELAGETVNHVSLLAAAQGLSKATILGVLIDRCASAHERAQRLLGPYPKALHAYLAFAHGYVEVHVVTKRYRLFELNM